MTNQKILIISIRILVISIIIIKNVKLYFAKQIQFYIYYIDYIL